MIHQKPKKALKEITSDLCPVSQILFLMSLFYMASSIICVTLLYPPTYSKCLIFSQALSIQQLYRISTMYWDDKYGTHSVSAEVTGNHILWESFLLSPFSPRFTHFPFCVVSQRSTHFTSLPFINLGKRTQPCNGFLGFCGKRTGEVSKLKWNRGRFSYLICLLSFGFTVSPFFSPLTV